MSGYMERTGVICNSQEMAVILPLVDPLKSPSAQLESVVYTAALRHGLPRLVTGSYGMDLVSGEFLRVVP